MNSGYLNPKPVCGGGGWWMGGNYWRFVTVGGEGAFIYVLFFKIVVTVLYTLSVK